METLKFADSHNMVAFLSKPAESEGFEQIIDFLNAHPIRYALTVNPTIYVSCIEQFWSSAVAKTINGEVQLHALVDGKRIVITETSVRRNLRLADAEGIDCFSNSTIFENLALMGYEKISEKLTFYEAFFSPQWKFLIHTILQCLSPNTTAWNEFSITMASAIICLATNQKFNFSKLIFDSMMMLSIRKRGDSYGEICHYYYLLLLLRSEQVIGNINKTKSKATHNEPSSKELVQLKKRVKKLEKRTRSRTHGLKRLHKVGMSRRVVFSDNEKSLGKDASKQGRIDDDAEMFDVGIVTGDEVFAEQEVAEKDVNLTVDEVTLAQALAALKSVKPKCYSASTKDSATTKTTATIPTPRKGIVITELGTPTITRSSQQPSQVKVQDKGKGKMVEPKPVKKIKERLSREKDEANVALTEVWDDIQAKIKADHELAQRLQAEEQEELSVEEKAKLFQQLLEQRRKYFAAKSAEEKRNKPPTQAQQRKIMCTYLKNMEGKKLKDLKKKSFDSIQKMFDRAFKWVNTFVNFRTDLVEGSSKRAGEKLEQEVTKQQKVEDDKEIAELKDLMEVILDEKEVAIDAIPLAVKPPNIVD
ncbi:hypothetical protein Tco_0272821 [Tanacetum coccineum]